MSFNNNMNFLNKPLRAFPQGSGGGSGQPNYPNQKPPLPQQHHNNNFHPNFRYSSFPQNQQNSNTFRSNNSDSSGQMSMNMGMGPSKFPNSMTNTANSLSVSDMNARPRIRNSHITPDRIENENQPPNDYRYSDPFRRYRCREHHNEPLIRICTHPQCANVTLMCDNCTISHSPEHREYLRSIEDFIDEVNVAFDAHQQVSNIYEIVPKDLLNFLRGEEEAVSRYTEHVEGQKKMVEEHFKSLIEGFKEMCNLRAEELRKGFDFNLEVFANNYSYFSQKLKNFYEYVGIEVFANEAYQSKENLIAQFKKLRNLSETVAYLKDMKVVYQNVKNFQNRIATESKVPKKDIEGEIVEEVRKYIQKIYQQISNPITLESKPSFADFLGMSSRGKMKTNQNFYEAYHVLAKQIEKTFENFQTSLSQLPVNEDFSKTCFFTLLDENFLPQQGQNQNSVQSTKRNAFQVNSGVTKKTSLELEVNIGNYFDFNAMYKILHYFEPGTNNLLVLDLKNLPSSQFKNEPKEVSLIQVSLDINFTIPYNNCSIITPDGRLFLCGGCEEGEVFNYLYEYNPQNDTLVRRRPMLSKRCNHGICMLSKDQILVAGGFLSAEVGSLSTCEVYNIKKDTWTYVSPMNRKSERHSLCNFNDELIYKLGGINDYSIERYTIRNNMWEVILVNRNVEIGHNCESIQINTEQILIFGGHYRGNLDQCSVLTVQADGEDVKETLVCYDDVLLPEKLYFHCPKSTVVFGEAVYAIDYGKQKVVRFGNGEWKCLN